MAPQTTVMRWTSRSTRRSTMKDRLAARNVSLWITLAVGALIAAALKKRRIFGSTDDGPFSTSDEADPLQTELEEVEAAR
jgi:hypothetical protein